MGFLLANIEIILSVLGLLIILAVPSIVNSQPDKFWEVTAITAVLVGLIHGIIFWLIRRRQRVIRARVFDEVRIALADVINNEVVALKLNARKLSGTSDHFAAIETHLQAVNKIANKITDYVNFLSEDSIRAWRDKYHKRDG
jgi:hypothetical protein